MAKSIPIKTYYEIVKALIFVALMVSIGLGISKGYSWINNKFEQHQQLFTMQMEAQRERFDIELNQLRAQTTVVQGSSAEWKAELAKLRKENQALMQLIKQNGEQINNVGEINTKYNEQLSVNLKKATDHMYKQGTGDINEQYFTKIYTKEKNSEGNIVEIPIAWSIFYPNKPSTEQWKTGVYPIEYKTKVIQAEQKDGQTNTYLESWAENNKDKESIGVKLPLYIELSSFTQVKIKTSEFQWWAPHISLNIDAGLSGVLDSKIGAGLSFSTSGYGRTANDINWKFIDLGISTDGDKLWGKFSPASYNIGDKLPIISNTFIGPYVGYDFDDDNVIGGISISIPF